MIVRYISIFLCFLFLNTVTCFANDSQPTVVRFHFLSLPNKTAASIDWVRVLDSDGKTVAFLDFGKDDSDISSPSYVILDENGGHWGDAMTVENISARPVNGRDSVWEHSAFILTLSKPIQDGMVIRIRYLDSGTDLMPIEYVKDEKIIRIGQIYLENSGKWLEDEFDIPVQK